MKLQNKLLLGVLFSTASFATEGDPDANSAPNIAQRFATQGISDELVFDFSVDGLADEDEDDSDDEEYDDLFGDDETDMDDLFGEQSDSIQEEQDAVRSGDIDDRVGVVSEQILLEDEQEADRLIKTIQRKNFLKLGRYEFSPYLGFVTNDPFINRYLFGVNGAYHATEIFAFELNMGYSPDLGESDWKSITSQLVNENKVSPDISKLTFFTNFGFQFSPIYGKVALSGRRIINFDVFGAFGMGLTLTQDDLDALGNDSDEAIATQNQWHPTTNIGGGVRIALDDSLAFRVEGRSMVYIETIASTTLEMKNNFLIAASASFFFPNVSR